MANQNLGVRNRKRAQQQLTPSLEWVWLISQGMLFLRPRWRAGLLHHLPW